jgi:hypothetical protein
LRLERRLAVANGFAAISMQVETEPALRRRLSVTMASAQARINTFEAAMVVDGDPGERHGLVDAAFRDGSADVLGASPIGSPAIPVPSAICPVATPQRTS